MTASDDPKAALCEAAAPLIQLAIEEDIGPGDATSLSTVPPDAVLSGRIIAKAAGVIAGLPIAEAVFAAVDTGISFTPRVDDGQEVVPGELVAEVGGPGQSLLAAERIALNFLQRMSGIATQTRNMVDAVATTDAAILDTRKTLPGFRVLDKYAVRMGGGTNHRMSLYDMVLIKDNHIDGAGGITAAVNSARQHFPDLPVEVEVRDLEELAEALTCDPPLDRILLDNMTSATMREAVALTAGRVPLEASGNVTLDRAEQIALIGVDYLSVGSLTHSVRALDLSMDVTQAGVAPETEAIERIQQAKAVLGDRMLILAHHYQRDAIVELANFSGDSLQLARQATETDAAYIVFCGVHFMAEGAAIMAKPGQHVLIPDETAGCYLADTATPQGVANAWAALDAALVNADGAVTPITYVNSSASLKAFCGRHGGITCTSSNAERVIRWALAQRPRVFFFPDQHLGRNTAHKMGIDNSAMLLWNPGQPPSESEIRSSRIILWPGACNVHQRFRPDHVEVARRRHPGVRVIVHPECQADVVALADENGSTSYIIKAIEEAPPGSRWAVGTESRLVYRLQVQHPDQQIVPLAQVAPFCATMTQITVGNLATVVEGLMQDRLINEITVEPETRHWAKLALERMLRI